jgi:hypothetical protein
LLITATRWRGDSICVKEKDLCRDLVPSSGFRAGLG